MVIRLQRWQTVTCVSSWSEITCNLPPLSKETKGLVVNSPFLSSVECPSRMGSGDKAWDSWENKMFQFKIHQTTSGCKKLILWGKSVIFTGSVILIVGRGSKLLMFAFCCAFYVKWKHSSLTTPKHIIIKNNKKTQSDKTTVRVQTTDMHTHAYTQWDTDTERSLY